jgi:hypothetical protein
MDGLIIKQYQNFFSTDLGHINEWMDGSTIKQYQNFFR